MGDFLGVLALGVEEVGEFGGSSRCFSLWGWLGNGNRGGEWFFFLVFFDCFRISHEYMIPDNKINGGDKILLFSGLIVLKYDHEE